MTKFCKLFILVFIVQGSLRAQDMHFTQFYASPLYLNPAFAGADVCSRVSLTYRNQWPGIFKTYKSYLLSLDHSFAAKNLGAGILVGNDLAGTGNLRTIIINPMIAYQIRLNREYVIRCAIQPGVTQRSIDFNSLLFGDQIGRGGNVATVEQPTVTKTFFDLGAGALFFSKFYWAGLSLYHINRPDESITSAEGAILPLKISTHGGYRYVLNEDEKDELHVKSVTGVMHYRHQKKFDQLDVGVYYTHGLVSFGVWYRGLPFKHYKPGYRNVDAIALILGMKSKRANFGYSFDITISQLAGLSRGAHELTMAYQLCKPSKRKKKKLVVPCPKF